MRSSGGSIPIQPGRAIIVNILSPTSSCPLNEESEQTPLEYVDLGMCLYDCRLDSFDRIRILRSNSDV